MKKVYRMANKCLVELDAYMDSQASFSNKVFLGVCGAITIISILTMILKWV